MLKMIFACDMVTRCIGKDGKLPWRISKDLKFFKEITMDHFVVCGRKTYESLPKLEGRKFIVITHDTSFKGNDKNPVFATASSAEKFMTLYQFLNGDVFIIGGASIYEEFKDYVDLIYIDEIEAADGIPYDGDTYIFDYHEDFYMSTHLFDTADYDKSSGSDNKKLVYLRVGIWRPKRF